MGKPTRVHTRVLGCKTVRFSVNEIDIQVEKLKSAELKVEI
jgi:hypothetical protein